MHHHAVRWLEYQGKVDEQTIFAFICKPCTTTSPFLEFRGIPTAVTAGALMEFQAVHHQELALEGFRTIPNEHKEALGSVLRNQLDYRVVLNLVATAVGETGFPKLEHGSLRQLLNLAHEMTSLALSPEWRGDALFALTPLSFDVLDHADLPDEPVMWKDIHPGWRLIKVKRALQAEGIRLSDFDNPRTIMQHIASKLGWPTPRQAVANFLSYCGRRVPHSFLLRDFHSLVLRHRRYART